jgi:hypothetical protein
LAARFLPISRRVRLCCDFWLPPPSQKPQRPNQQVYKNGCPLLSLQHAKNYTDAASKASREQCLRSAGKRANFSAAKNLPFCSKSPQNLQGFKEDFGVAAI